MLTGCSKIVAVSLTPTLFEWGNWEVAVLRFAFGILKKQTLMGLENILFSSRL